jgi:three-Cys-motif partner protein
MAGIQQEEYDRLRLNSHIKHRILQDYLAGWVWILKKWNPELNYFDCFAGPGRYLWKGDLVDGSPLVSLKVCAALLNSNVEKKPKNISLTFIEKDPRQVDRLTKEIQAATQAEPLPSGLTYDIHLYKSRSFLQERLDPAVTLAPSFFFVDPYSHPLPLEMMKAIMARPKTEIMLNYMFYQIVRDLPNPEKEELCNVFFFPDKTEDVIRETHDGERFDEQKTLEHLHRRIGAKYYIPFSVYFGPDEGVEARRVKYFLIHYSNNFKAFHLMLHTMWKFGDPGNPLMVEDGQPVLFPSKDVRELRRLIERKYVGTGRRISFDGIMEENWRWYFLEKHYREVLKDMEKKGRIQIRRVASKDKGLKENDIVVFTEGAGADGKKKDALI